MKFDKKRSISDIIWAVIFGIYIAALLWLTIFSRLGSNTRAFYPLFHSYSELFNGNKDFFVLGVANIALFVPFGFFLEYLTELKRRHKTCIGFGASLFIESCQWIFKLGEFECDDLLNNAIGTFLGCFFCACILHLLNKNKNRSFCKKDFCFALLITAILVECVPFGYKYVKHLIMVERASYFDLDDGTKNLLVLNGDSGYVGDSDVYVEFLKDGSISISGSSEVRAWKEIAELELENGTYEFSGLSGVEEKTVALELDYYDEESDGYKRITGDIGPKEKEVFTIERTLKVRAYVGVYKECEISISAYPTLYIHKV